MLIRPETQADHSAIAALVEAAFDNAAEARLVSKLRISASPFISLVADEAGAITGHISFSPVVLDRASTLTILGLAPLSVAPQKQRSGIGTRLVTEGLNACRDVSAGAVVVLGHPSYYPRFGFVRASLFNIGSEYDVADDKFMALELVPGYLKLATGIAQYHEAFRDV
ncbi:MAG: N-acetyltransferase [Candidatus Competibacteraceae bacterium]